ERIIRDYIAVGLSPGPVVEAVRTGGGVVRVVAVRRDIVAVHIDRSEGCHGDSEHGVDPGLNDHAAGDPVLLLLPAGSFNITGGTNNRLQTCVGDIDVVVPRAGVV